MIKSNKTYLVIIALLFAILIIVESIKPKSFSWEVTLSNKDRIPFGSYLLYKNLHVLVNDQPVKTANLSIFEELLQPSYPRVNYILLSESFSPDSLDVATIKNRASGGDNFFIAANIFNRVFSDYFSIETSVVTDYPDILIKDDSLLNNYLFEDLYSFGDTISCMFENPKLNPRIWYEFDRGVPNIHFTKIDSSKSIILGSDERNHTNFIKIPIGKGNLFVHCLPQIFTNYYLAHPDKYKYLFKALSYLPVAPTYWDEYYHKIHVSNDDIAASNSPLRFILSNEYLKYGLWIIIAATVLLMIFHAKRVQRIIPVIPPVHNTTLKFIDVVSRMYQQDSNHKLIIEKKTGFFLTFIRNKFHLTTETIDSSFVRDLELRSGIDNKEITNLFNYLDYIKKLKVVRTEQLIKLSTMIEKFVQKTGYKSQV